MYIYTHRHHFLTILLQMAVPHLVLEPRAHQQAARKEDHEQAGTHRLALKH